MKKLVVKKKYKNTKYFKDIPFFFESDNGKLLQKIEKKKAVSNGN